MFTKTQSRRKFLRNGAAAMGLASTSLAGKTFYQKTHIIKSIVLKGLWNTKICYSNGYIQIYYRFVIPAPPSGRNQLHYIYYCYTQIWIPAFAGMTVVFQSDDSIIRLRMVFRKSSKLRMESPEYI